MDEGLFDWFVYFLLIIDKFFFLSKTRLELYRCSIKDTLLRGLLCLAGCMQVYSIGSSISVHWMDREIWDLKFQSCLWINNFCRREEFQLNNHLCAQLCSEELSVVGSRSLQFVKRHRTERHRTDSVNPA